MTKDVHKQSSHEGLLIFRTIKERVQYARSFGLDVVQDYIQMVFNDLKFELRDTLLYKIPQNTHSGE